MEDLERYLTSRPILARPPSTFYQVRKLVGRHRAAFGSAALAVVLLLIFSITVTVQLGIQRRERLRAEREARKAQRINTFLQEMLAAADPMRQGGEATIHEVLDEAARRADDGLENEPDVAVELRRTLGRTFATLGLGARAGEQLERGLALSRRVFGEKDPETARARLDFASWLKGESRYEEAK